MGSELRNSFVVDEGRGVVVVVVEGGRVVVGVAIVVDCARCRSVTARVVVVLLTIVVVEVDRFPIRPFQCIRIFYNKFQPND